MIRVFGGKKLPFKTEDLVIATNNQNRMEPRNLRSNTTTQKAIERDFAKLGWFYERKEKAWEAFVDSDGQWDTLKGHKPNKFGGRGKDRRVVDNIDVATAALAFSGFSDVARDRKSAIFSEDRLYRRVFEMHSAKHGARFDPQFQYPRSDNSDLIQNEVPAASILLLAQLTYLAAKQVAPKSSEMKAAFAERLGVTNETIEKKNAALLDDPGYLAQLMMLSSPMLLTELIGYAFYEIPIDRRPAAAEKILKTTDFKSLFFEKDFNAFKINTEQPIGKTDFFRGFYKLLEFILTEFADSTTFRQDLLSASSRPSYIHGKSVRRKIIERVSELDSQIRRNSALSRDWSAPFDENKSITKALAAFTIN
jgi:hypothetical protein